MERIAAMSRCGQTHRQVLVVVKFAPLEKVGLVRRRRRRRRSLSEQAVLGYSLKQVVEQ